MNLDNLFGLFIDVVFSMSPQLVDLVQKYQELLISFCLGEEENLSKFHRRARQVQNEIFLFNYETRQTNNLTGKHIMEVKIFKHLQFHRTAFELEYRDFE